MVKLTILAVGKLKEDYLSAAQAEYLKRLSRFCRAEVREFPERRTLKEEASDLLRAAKGHVYALAVEGKQHSSEEFARGIRSVIDRGENLVFIIGSSCGLDDSVKRAADELLSFSAMTFPHQLMRVILLEQVYRAFMINAGAKYHK